MEWTPFRSANLARQFECVPKGPGGRRALATYRRNLDSSAPEDSVGFSRRTCSRGSLFAVGVLRFGDRLTQGSEVLG
jgi:hypothetical protein